MFPSRWRSCNLAAWACRDGSPPDQRALSPCGGARDRACCRLACRAGIGAKIRRAFRVVVRAQYRPKPARVPFPSLPAATDHAQLRATAHAARAERGTDGARSRPGPLLRRDLRSGRRRAVSNRGGKSVPGRRGVPAPVCLLSDQRAGRHDRHRSATSFPLFGAGRRAGDPLWRRRRARRFRLVGHRDHSRQAGMAGLVSAEGDDRSASPK